MAAIAVGAAAAIYAERATMRSGLIVLGHTRLAWVAGGICVEFGSMAALAQMERILLRASGARMSLRAMLATAYNGNAIAVAVPVIGSAMATAYIYRDLRRYGTRPEQASVALTVAGIFSTLAFAVLAAAGAIISANPAAAWVALVGSAALAAVVGSVLLALRFGAVRSMLEPRAVALLRLAQRVAHRPRGEPRELVATALARVGASRVGGWTAGAAFLCALANWVADAICLVCALKAAGAPVPWNKILLIWSAGSGAASLTPVPAGLGVVDVVLIAALSAAGLHPARAVAAVLLYRVITFKIVVSLGWFGYHYRRQRKETAGQPPVTQLSATPGPTARRAGDGRDLPYPHAGHVR